MFHVKHYLEKPNDPHVYRGVRLLTGDGMAYFKLLIVSVAAAAFMSSAQAGYAQLKPPPGWSQGLSAMTTPVTSVAAVGTYNFGTAANASRIGFPAAANSPTFSKGKVLTMAALSVAGNTAGIPVALKIGVDAALAATTFSFGNPALFAGGRSQSGAVRSFFQIVQLSSGQLGGQHVSWLFLAQR